MAQEATVITFGTYDVFHYGHLRALERAAARGARLVVGVASDALAAKEGRSPAVGEEQRCALVRALACVDEVFLEESREERREYCRKYEADVVISGDELFNEGAGECAPVLRTLGVSTTTLQRSVVSAACLDELPTHASSETPSPSAYTAAGKNLVRAVKQSNPFTAALVSAHDCYYEAVMKTWTPFCAAMPRHVTVRGHTVTIFSANAVTYARGLLAIPIAMAMRSGWLGTAAFLVMYHDFLDHLDGVVAKQHARDGRSKGDDGMWGAFLDAQMDKLVFCLCLWSFALSVDYAAAPRLLAIVVVATCATLFGLEFAIGAVRTKDYFTAKLAPAAGKKRVALRAVSEGKLKQKFESTGIAVYCLALPDLGTNLRMTVCGTACLWLAAYFSVQSLKHKLRGLQPTPLDGQPQ